MLVDSAGILPKKSMKQKFKTRLYKIGRRFLSIGVVKKLYPDALENYRRSHGSADYNSATPVMRQTLVKVVNEDLEPLLSSIETAAVLLIWGDMDTATPLSDARIMEDRIKDSGLVVVKAPDITPIWSSRILFAECWILIFQPWIPICQAIKSSGIPARKRG